MIKYDSSSIYDRLLGRLQQDPDWKAVSNNSVITAMLKSNAEVMAETARYAEYLFKESKWDTAQNTSSILAMSNALGYRPKRKVSASGTIYISADPKTHLVGKTISPDNFKSLNNSVSSNSLSWRRESSEIKIPSTVSIVDSKGNSYVTTGTFISRNAAYTSLNILQGQRKSVIIDVDTMRSIFTTSKIDPYLYIPITISSCENADTSISRAFFKVYIIKGENSVEYRVVDSLLLSTYGDRDVEVYNDPYNRNLFYFKFNNDPLRGNPYNLIDLSQGTSILGMRVDYLESKGSEGNLSSLFENFTITGAYTEDTKSSTKLYGVNLDALIGGADEETSVDVKNNAPKYYITNYGIGTKEAYEKTISNLQFPLGTKTVSPSKVKVYKGSETDDLGYVKDTTCVTFLAEALEDLTSSDTSTYETIEKYLNFYLENLKSPQDNLVFRAPKYISFGVGLNCILDRNTTDSQNIISNIRDYVENQWGPASNELDFDRNFYYSQLLTDLKNENENIKGIDIEVEAIKKLDWAESSRKDPTGREDVDSQTIHTCRIPFAFDNVFYGQGAIKGFKDYRSGANYVMRIDFMYKKPSNLTSTASYHTSLFIAENSNSRTSDSFYVLNDSNANNSVWKKDTLINLADYSGISDASLLNKTYQFRYKNKIYTDGEFRNLVDESQLTDNSLLKTYLVDPGTIDDYLIYFSPTYDESNSLLGSGYLEITFDPIYRMLSTFALFDTDLKTKLNNCSLALLKCGNSAQGEDPFKVFKAIVKDWVDIYVCMRPYDKNLLFTNNNDSNENSVLYIDCSDSDSTNSKLNLTSDKRSRVISIDYNYEE